MSGSSPDLQALAAMSAEQYLSCFNLEFYIRDLLGHIVDRKGESLDRSPLEFMAQYFDVVLRGEHVISRDFQYIDSTPLNRRAFVKLLRKGLMGTCSNSSQALLTATDFHDLVVVVCPDFPSSIIEEAARYAEKADERKHFPLGEIDSSSTADPQANSGSKASAAAAEARVLTAAEESSKFNDDLYVLSSLQRLVEFMFVYSEVIGILKLVFRHGHGGGFAEDGAGIVDTERRRSAPAAGALNRGQVVDELQRRARKLLGIAFPSKAALDSLRSTSEAGPDLRSETPVSEHLASYGPQDVAQLVTFREVLLELAETSELTMEPYPEELMRNIPIASQDAVEVPEPDAPNKDALKDKQKKKKKRILPAAPAER